MNKSSRQGLAVRPEPKDTIQAVRGGSSSVIEAALGHNLSMESPSKSGKEWGCGYGPERDLGVNVNRILNTENAASGPLRRAPMLLNLPSKGGVGSHADRSRRKAVLCESRVLGLDDKGPHGLNLRRAESLAQGQCNTDQWALGSAVNSTGSNADRTPRSRRVADLSSTWLVRLAPVSPVTGQQARRTAVELGGARI